MVNAELFRKIADRIEAEPAIYDQRTYESKCGTVCCIFGWAWNLSGRKSYPGNTFSGLCGELGIDRQPATLLFDPNWKPRPDLTVPQALRLIADGKSVSEVSA